MQLKRGDLVFVNLEPVIGSEQGEERPALIIQNNSGNKYSPVTIIAPITSKTFIREYSTNVKILAEESHLKKDSTILLNQIRTIDKSRVIKKLHSLDAETMDKVNLAIKISLDLS